MNLVADFESTTERKLAKRQIVRERPARMLLSASGCCCRRLAAALIAGEKTMARCTILLIIPVQTSLE